MPLWMYGVGWGAGGTVIGEVDFRWFCMCLHPGVGVCESLVGAFRRLNISPRVHETIRRVKCRGPVPMRRRIVPCLLKRGGSMMTLTRAKAKGATTFNLPLVRRVGMGGHIPRSLVLYPAQRLYLRVTNSLGSCSGCVSKLGMLPMCNKSSVSDRVHDLGHNMRVVMTAPNHLLSLVRHGAISLSAVDGIMVSRTSRVLGVKFASDVGTVLTSIPRRHGALLFSTAVDPRVTHVSGGCLHSTGRVAVKHGGRDAGDIGRVTCVIRTGSGCTMLGHMTSCYPRVCNVIFYHAHGRARRVTSGLVRRNCGTSSLRKRLSRTRHSTIVRGFHLHGVRVLITASMTTHKLSMGSLARIVGCNLPSSARDCARHDKHAKHTKGANVSVTVIGVHRGKGVHRVRHVVNGGFVVRRIPANGRVYRGRLVGMVSSVRGMGIGRRRVTSFVPRVCHGLR